MHNINRQSKRESIKIQVKHLLLVMAKKVRTFYFFLGWSYLCSYCRLLSQWSHGTWMLILTILWYHDSVQFYLFLSTLPLFPRFHPHVRFDNERHTFCIDKARKLMKLWVPILQDTNITFPESQGIPTNIEIYQMWLLLFSYSLLWILVFFRVYFNLIRAISS